METQSARRWDDILAKELQDPEFREQWEHTAPARAVALAIIRYRAEHHLSQSGLARLLGVKQSTVARWETGEHNPTWETLLLIAEKLGITVSLTVGPIVSAQESVAEEIARVVKSGTVSRIESPTTKTSATIVTRTPGASDSEFIRV